MGKIFNHFDIENIDIKEDTHFFKNVRRHEIVTFKKKIKFLKKYIPPKLVDFGNSIISFCGCTLLFHQTTTQHIVVVQVETDVVGPKVQIVV